MPWIGKTAKLIGIYFTEKMQEKGFDLTKQQWVVLKILREEDGRPQNDLADVTGKNKATLTRLLQTLEKKNLVARIPSKEDKRVVHIYLTKKGIETIDSTEPVVMEMANELQDGLTDVEVKSAKVVLEKILNNVERKRN